MEISEINQRKLEEHRSRLQAAIGLTEGDRVPFAPKTEAFPVVKYGLSRYDWMKDARNAIPCAERYLNEYDLDLVWPLSPPVSIDPFELLGANAVRLPGPTHGLPMDSGFQILDGTYMEDDEFDEYLRDPTHFVLTKVYPRRFKSLEGLSNISFSNVGDLPIMGEICALSAPPAGKSWETLLQAARMSAQRMQWNRMVDQKIVEHGCIPRGGVATAPFDIYADNLRGLITAVMDTIEFPDEALAVTERIADLTIDRTVARAKAMGNTTLFIPLHAGVDEFMSNETYGKFYWPTLKRLICAIIDAGITPYVFCEGKYSTRFEFLKDVPPKKVIYMFEEIDIARAKRELEGIACVCGNLSTTLLMTGKPEEVVDETKKMLDACAPGGGFIMDCSIVMADARPENFDAWYETTLTYGAY